MADVTINKFRASVVRDGSKPSSPGFIVSEGQDPVDPAGTGQNHLPVTINTAATGLAITDSQVLGGAGTVGQYIRGDGSLADFPESSGGGSSVSYYLNGSVNQGTIGGVAYKELNKVPILGAGTDFTINADGYIASFLTDAGDPNLLEIPSGNWNFETYFSASSGGGSPSFYVELYKVNSGGTATLIASNSTFPELIAFGTNVISYFSTLAVPTTALALTDRLAIRYYVNHSGRTITLHTEDNHLCQIITTFTTGLTALNGLTAQIQNFAVGTSGTDFAIASATATHTFNLPTASATNRGALSSADWTTFNGKQNALTNPVTGTGASGQVAYFTGTSAISSESNLFWDATNDRLGVGTNTPATTLDVNGVGLFTGASLAGNTKNGVYIFDSVITSLAGGSARALQIQGQTLSFFTGATYTEKLKVFENGNVVISTSPTDNGAKLQVSGTATVSGALTINGDLNFNSAGGTTYVNINQGTGADGGIILKRANVNRWQIAQTISGDNIVFYSYGTSNEVLRLNYSTGTSSFDTTSAINAIFNSTNASGGYIGFRRSGTSIGYLGNSAQLGIGVNNALELRADNNLYLTTTSGTLSMLSTGNVGIGPASPVLENGGGQVIYNSTVPRLAFRNSTSGTTALDGTDLALVSSDFYVFNREAGAIIFGTSGLDRMRITSSGNVGIGVTNPQSKLHIDGVLTFTESGFPTVRLNQIQSSHSDGSSTNNNLRFLVSDGSGTTAERMRVNGNGNVLIGTTTDNGVGKLQVSGGSITVAGGVRFSSSGADANRWSVYWNGGTGDLIVVNNISDIRAKKDFDYNIKGLETIQKLKPLKFTWKDGTSHSTSVSGRLRQYGFIAQETMQADDFLAWHNESHDTWGIEQYESFTAVMVKAIQELKQEIDTLKN